MAMMLCVMMPVGVSASGQVNTQINVVSQVVSTGQATTRVNVPIEISGNTGIAGLLMEVSFDNGLTLVGVDEGTVFDGMELTVSGSLNSPVKILWDGAEDDTSNGTIATLKFDVPTASVGKYDIELSANAYDICDANQNNVSATLVNGTISVEDPNAPKIVVEEVDGTAGNTVDVKISIENNPGIIAMKLSMNYDDSLTLTNVADGLLPKVAHSQTIDTKPYIMSWGDDVATENITGDGTVATLTFEIASDAVGGSVLPITVTYNAADIYDVNTNPVAFNVQNGSVNIITYLIGDVNMDNAVNTKDRTFLARYLAEWPSYMNGVVSLSASDVNADGNVDTKDRTVLARHLAEWPAYLVLPYKK